MQIIFLGVVTAQSTIDTAVEQQDVSSAQAQVAIAGASRKASRVADDLRALVAEI